MKNKKLNIILLLIASITPIVAVLYTLLLMNFNSLTISLIVLFSWISIISGLILSIKHKRRTFTIIGVVSIIITLVIHLSDISTNLFLGDEIAYDYVADAPGFTEVKLFKNGKATIGYGGIFGVTDIFYLDYSIDGNNVILLAKDNSISIMNYSIEMDNKTYDLKLKTKS